MPVINFPSASQNPVAAGVISLGKVYIGNVNTNPRILANRVSVTIIQQDGTPVVIAPASQPFVLNAGGMFTYGGSPVILTSDASYSMAVDTAQDVQVYYLPNSVTTTADLNSSLLVLPTRVSAPSATAGTGKVFSMTVGGIVELFYIDSAGNIVQLTSAGAINIDLGSETVTAAIFAAVQEVTGTQFRGEPVTLTIDGSGNVACDVTLGLNYSLTLTQNVGTFTFTNMPTGRLPNLCIEIKNNAAYTITTFQVSTPGAQIWAPVNIASLQPIANTRTVYGLALFPGAIFHIFPVEMHQLI